MSVTRSVKKKTDRQKAAASVGHVEHMRRLRSLARKALYTAFTSALTDKQLRQLYENLCAGMPYNGRSYITTYTNNGVRSLAGCCPATMANTRFNIKTLLDDNHALSIRASWRNCYHDMCSATKGILSFPTALHILSRDDVVRSAVKAMKKRGLLRPCSY